MNSESQLALNNLVKIGQLKVEPTNLIELQGLIRSAEIRIKDAKVNSLSLESKFDLAYNAAHSVALAALRKQGYRSENRYQVFQCLLHTLNLPNNQWMLLDQAHRKRNLAEYEGDIDVTLNFVSELIQIVDEIISKLRT